MVALYPFFYLMTFTTEKLNIKTNTLASYKTCENCKYFSPSPIYSDIDMSKCTKYGRKQVNVKKITYEYADICRLDENKCGKDGKHFDTIKNKKNKSINQ